MILRLLVILCILNSVLVSPSPPPNLSAKIDVYESKLWFSSANLDQLSQEKISRLAASQPQAMEHLLDRIPVERQFELLTFDSTIYDLLEPHIKGRLIKHKNAGQISLQLFQSGLLNQSSVDSAVNQLMAMGHIGESVLEYHGRRSARYGQRKFHWRLRWAVVKWRWRRDRQKMSGIRSVWKSLGSDSLQLGARRQAAAKIRESEVMLADAISRGHWASVEAFFNAGVDLLSAYQLSPLDKSIFDISQSLLSDSSINTQQHAQLLLRLLQLGVPLSLPQSGEEYSIKPVLSRMIFKRFGPSLMIYMLLSTACNAADPSLLPLTQSDAYSALQDAIQADHLQYCRFILLFFRMNFPGEMQNLRKQSNNGESWLMVAVKSNATRVFDSLLHGSFFEPIENNETAETQVITLDYPAFRQASMNPMRYFFEQLLPFASIEQLNRLLLKSLKEPALSVWPIVAIVPGPPSIFNRNPFNNQPAVVQMLKWLAASGERVELLKRLDLEPILLNAIELDRPKIVNELLTVTWNATASSSTLLQIRPGQNIDYISAALNLAATTVADDWALQVLLKNGAYVSINLHLSKCLGMEDVLKNSTGTIAEIQLARMYQLLDKYRKQIAASVKKVQLWETALDFALVMAAKYNNFPAVILLLGNGASRDYKEGMAIRSAATAGNAYVLALLTLPSNVNPRLDDTLKEFIAREMPYLVKYLQSPFGSDLEYEHLIHTITRHQGFQHWRDYEALRNASHRGHAEAVETLLSAAASESEDQSIPFYILNDALCLAIRGRANNNVIIVDKLLESGANPWRYLEPTIAQYEARCGIGCEALQVAALINHEEIVVKLLLLREKYLEIASSEEEMKDMLTKQFTECDRSALVIAARNGFGAIMDRILRVGGLYSIGSANDNHELLVAAARGGQLPMVSSILQLFYKPHKIIPPREAVEAALNGQTPNTATILRKLAELGAGRDVLLDAVLTILKIDETERKAKNDPNRKNQSLHDLMEPAMKASSLLISAGLAIDYQLVHQFPREFRDLKVIWRLMQIVFLQSPDYDKWIENGTLVPDSPFKRYMIRLNHVRSLIQDPRLVMKNSKSVRDSEFALAEIDILVMAIAADDGGLVRSVLQSASSGLNNSQMANTIINYLLPVGLTLVHFATILNAQNSLNALLSFQSPNLNRIRSAVNTRIDAREFAEGQLMTKSFSSSITERDFEIFLRLGNKKEIEETIKKSVRRFATYLIFLNLSKFKHRDFFSFAFDNGMSSLHLAQTGSVVRLLRRFSADGCLRDYNYDRTALMFRINIATDPANYDYDLLKELAHDSRDCINEFIGHSPLPAQQQHEQQRTQQQQQRQDLLQQTLLHIAQTARLVDLLLEAGADACIEDSAGRTSLIYRLIKPEVIDLGIMHRLIRASADCINAINVFSGRSVLMLAAKRGLDLVKAVLSVPGVDVNYQHPRTGNTALMDAVQSNQPALVQLLVKQGGADYMKLKNLSGLTAWQMAAGQRELRALLQAPNWWGRLRQRFWWHMNYSRLDK